MKKRDRVNEDRRLVILAAVQAQHAADYILRKNPEGFDERSGEK